MQKISRKRMTFDEILAERVQVNPVSDCWEYQGSRTPNGYGKYNKDYVHRMSYERHKGEIPIGYVVMHSCDNPCCCNPNHLSIGTQKDNMQDCKNKNRLGDKKRKGESNGRCKISDNDVVYILKSTKTNRELSELFGVSPNRIGQIRRGDRL